MFYLNDFKKHLKTLADSVETDYTTPDAHKKYADKHASLTETYNNSVANKGPKNTSLYDMGVVSDEEPFNLFG